MSKPAPSLADVQSLAARCVDMADPQLDADFEAKFGQAPAVFAALPAQAQQAHLQSHADAAKGVKYAVGNWGHLFGSDRHETNCRIVIDVENGELVAAQEKDGLKFVDIRGERFRDLAESVIEVNEAHNGYLDYGLILSNELPGWAGGLANAGSTLQRKADLLANSVPTLHEFREAKRFVKDLHQITGEARDHQVRAFQYPGGVLLRISARDATCSIEVKQKNWGGQNAVYELPFDQTESEPDDYLSPPSGGAGVAPGSIVCGRVQDGCYTLTSFHRLAFASGMLALEEILYEREFLREHVPAQAAELALRAVYERSPEYSDPQLGGGDFMQMVEKFAKEDFYAHHHLAKHLQHLCNEAFESYAFKADECGPSLAM